MSPESRTRCLAAPWPRIPAAAPLVVTGVLALVAAGMVALAMPGAHPHEVEQPTRTPFEGGQRIVLRLLALAFIVSAATGSFHVGLALRGKQELVWRRTRLRRCSFKWSALSHPPEARADVGGTQGAPMP